VPDLSAYVDFSVILDKSDADNPVITFTDISTYPDGVAPTVTGVVSATQPDRISRDGSFTSPDISWNGSELPPFNFELRLNDTDESFQLGGYTFTYIVKATGYDDTTKTKTFALAYSQPELLITDSEDVFTPQLLVADYTVYPQEGFAAPTISRAWLAYIRYAGTSIASKTGTGALLDLAYNTYYYDAHYDVTLTTTLTYILNSPDGWVTVIDQLEATNQFDAYTPPTLAQLRTSLATMKTEIEAGTWCGGRCGCGCNIDYTPYTEAVAIYDQLVAQGQNGETIGLQTYVEQLLKIFNCSGLLTQVHTNVPIPAYDWENTGSGIIPDTFTLIRVQFRVGVPTSILPSGYPIMNDGDTVYIIPVPVVDDSELVFYMGVPVDRYVPDDTNPDFYYEISYGALNAVITFSQPVSIYSGVKINFMQNISNASFNGGLQSVEITAPTTGNTLTVAALASKTFVTATTGTQAFINDVSQVTQSGTVLDFTAVGGVTAGQKITIFYK